ncbi:MAG TPA: SRPBCC family protein [Acidimicrobiales bacterium]|nr:SRPBCC family protein [Acidimicrobiales bacterium]
MAQRATESIVVRAPVDVVYEVVTDFARYGEWVSELKYVEILDRDTAGRALDVAFRAAAFGRSTSYTLRYDYSRAPEELNWTQTDGDLAESLHGQYRFEAVGDATRVTYDLEVELGVPIPTFVKSRAAQRIQSQALSELKARAESFR